MLALLLPPPPPPPAPILLPLLPPPYPMLSLRNDDDECNGTLVADDDCGFLISYLMLGFCIIDALLQLMAELLVASVS